MALIIRNSLLLLLHCILLVYQTEAVAAAAGGGGKNNSLNYRRRAPALFVFGDSTVDTGNNNYIKTVARANFPPYGRNFRHHEATGRFCNGRLLCDYIASYMGIKRNMPPYLDPNLSLHELMTGVVFASAGSGIDPLTATVPRVIPLSQQLEYFKEYKQRVGDQIGPVRMQKLITGSVYLISAGTNDFGLNYLPLPVRKIYTVHGYSQFLVDQVTDFIQDLRDEGVRSIVILGIPPLGCLPILISTNLLDPTRRCLDFYSSLSRDYNSLLQNRLANMMQNQTNRGLKLYYGDIYGPTLHMIQNRELYGFEEVNIGCCGTGVLEVSYICKLTLSSCPDATKYIFWDSVHPTEKANYHLFLSIRKAIDSALSAR